jgi:hypothetical protein
VTLAQGLDPLHVDEALELAAARWREFQHSRSVSSGDSDVRTEHNDEPLAGSDGLRIGQCRGGPGMRGLDTRVEAVLAEYAARPEREAQRVASGEDIRAVVED